MATVLVDLKAIYDNRGRVKYVNHRPTVQQIKSTYEDGRVMTQSGDVWQVEPYEGKKADFKVVA